MIEKCIFVYCLANIPSLKAINRSFSLIILYSEYIIIISLL